MLEEEPEAPALPTCVTICAITNGVTSTDVPPECDTLDAISTCVIEDGGCTDAADLAYATAMVGQIYAGRAQMDGAACDNAPAAAIVEPEAEEEVEAPATPTCVMMCAAMNGVTSTEVVPECDTLDAISTCVFEDGACTDAADLAIATGMMEQFYAGRAC